MYKDYRKFRTEYLKVLNENNVDLKNLDPKSNPCLAIRTWDGQGEMPTTIKSADMDDVIKKIAHKEGQDKLKRTDVFESAFDKVFGKGTNSFRPYEDISDTDYKDALKSTYKSNFLSEEAEEKEEEVKDDKNLKMELDDLKASEPEDMDEEDDDDDDDDDDDNLKESFLGFDFNEADMEEHIEKFVNENVEIEDVSPISLLEDTDESITNINTLLEQTQAIEDEVDSILSFNEGTKFSNTISESELNSILENNEDMDYLLDSEFLEEDFSDYLDENLI